ncbi:hypothetical protein [Candidatus Kuenenia stuttgartiensis]|uniref:hypothetical protein n=1 Tax=Kuenenia stuttgartiensis TaxID=174633 RepID=UPI00146A6B7E|nr:hypothetical protein [Candidatus Kuenenia stuttgartiensis]
MDKMVGNFFLFNSSCCCYFHFRISHSSLEKSITQKVVLLLENKLPSSAQTGTVSYHWPNQIRISLIILQKQNNDPETTTQFDDIQGTLKLFPLLWNQVIFEKLRLNK